VRPAGLFNAAVLSLLLWLALLGLAALLLYALYTVL
jgi:hypothetical protein